MKGRERMKRVLLIAIVALVLVAALLLAMPQTKKEAPADPTPDCVSSFMKGWAINFVDDMLTPCAPSWKAQQSNPELQMFQLMANRTAAAWNIGQPAKDGDALIYPVDVLLRRNNVTQDGWQRFTLRVVTENGEQYVIPDGIAACEPVKAPKNYVTP